jgi:uncharacterized membrane protein YdbT with pleckstrin-like domain
MGYIEQNLVANEKVLFKTRVHWIVLAKPFLFALALLFVPGAILVWAKGKEYLWAEVALFALGIIVIAIGTVQRNATEMAVTNQRVLIKQGIASRKSLELVLAKVESIAVHESAIGRILGFGTLVIRGTGGTFETFTEIARPNEFRKQVQEQIAKPITP